MTTEYSRALVREAKEIAGTLEQLQALLEESVKLNNNYKVNLQDLLDKGEEVLENINSARESLASLEEDNVIKSDPSFVNLRHQFTRRIEKAKREFERDIVRPLENLTRQVVENSKQNPPEKVDENNLMPHPSGERWTVQKMLDMASQFVDQAAKAGAIATKAFALARALGLVFGIPFP
jgi:F0F1-type ATP synthase membrane subunit b/b'